VPHQTVTTAHVLLVRPAGSVERVVFVPAAAALPADQVLRSGGTRHALALVIAIIFIQHAFVTEKKQMKILCSRQKNETLVISREL
jgi:hypothetical protein